MIGPLYSSAFDFCSASILRSPPVLSCIMFFPVSLDLVAGMVLLLCKTGLALVSHLAGVVVHSPILWPRLLQNLHLTNEHSSLKLPFLPQFQHTSGLPGACLLPGENFFFFPLPPPGINGGDLAAILSFFTVFWGFILYQSFPSVVSFPIHLAVANRANSSSSEAFHSTGLVIMEESTVKEGVELFS